MLKSLILSALILLSGTESHSPSYDYQSIKRSSLTMEKETEILLTWKREIWEATAYNEYEDSCGKEPQDPLFGITASGTRVTEHRTVATASSIPFNTPIYIPLRKEQINGGMYRSEDRGDAITDRHIDIYIPSEKECFEFGRRSIEVYIPRS